MKKTLNSKKVLSLALASLFTFAQGSIGFASSEGADIKLGNIDPEIGYSEEYNSDDIRTLSTLSTRSTMQDEECFLEREPNNSISPDLSSFIYVDDNIRFSSAYGVVSQVDPSDYYELTFESTRVYTIRALKPSNQIITYSVYDSDGNLFVPETTSTRDIFFEGGTKYYLKVKWEDSGAASRVGIEPYEIRVTKTRV